MGATIQPTVRQETEQSNESRKKKSQDSLHEDKVDKPLVVQPTARRKTKLVVQPTARRKTKLVVQPTAKRKTKLVVQPTARQQPGQSNESRKKKSQDFQLEDKVNKTLVKQPTVRKVEQNEQSNKSRNKPLVVVAIDFGTVHSGFAYSFKGNEDNIKSAEHGGMLQEDRVPTILLLKPDKTFNSFGYNAQTDFHELSECDRSTFYYFENFKMKIYQESKIEREMVVKDISGKPLEAMTVFSIAIKHLKHEASKIVLDSILGLKETDIQWMITIPAISSDSARQFMREASTKAGIPETHLRLVLEPEAAALYSTPRIMTEAIPCGFMYILADLGGGTTDICAHKIIDGGKIQEIFRTTGETSGGSDVDDCFINMMKTLIGEKVWSEFSTTHPSACVSLVNEFRLKKKELKSQTNNIQLRMENALVHVIGGKKMNLNDIVKKSKYVRKLEYNSMDARLTINREMLEDLFKPSVDKIISKLVDVLKQCDENEMRTIILVGGYSESPYVRERIQSTFSKMRVILVDDARLAVLNGAVMMGWKPKNIIQRRSRYTYGFAVYKPFRKGIDPEQLRIYYDGDIYCDMIFQKMIEKGQIVEYGQTFISEQYETATTVEEKYKVRYVDLYRSTQKDPQYCIEEEDCSLVGTIRILPPSDGWPDMWDHDLHLIVGETEFTVKYFNLNTGQEYEAQMDFL
ncbi:heat shock 70 kDa protein 12A-like [Ruditapes philippinarum]|uniref:heat shock 70 kDa protein 12A-like n=1 Tax=Ruditapes philippinarum TaxID=129788 RepID=UPI00295AD262|nr:heat shock 70 kDa protein 12A-like [Ruditapes philippinarum]